MVSDARSADSGRAGLAAVLASNLLPVFGVVVLGWRVAELLVVYWIEVVVMVAAYNVAALFAERPIVLEDRSFYIVGFSKRSERDPERWDGDPEPAGVVDGALPAALADRLPPIYRRNVAVVGRSLGIVGFLAVGAAYLSDAVVANPVAAATSPTVLAASLAVCVSQAAELRREFFAARRYEEWSAYMTLEAAQRVVVFYVGVGLLAVPVSMLGAVGLAGALGGLGVDPVALAYVVPFSLAKAVVDRSRQLASDAADPSGFAGWFVPEDPRPEWQRSR